MKVLVTGATGFVGGHLVPRLVDAGHAVVAAGRSAPALDDYLNPVEKAVVPDIGPETDWRAALRNVDVVIHLAARAHVLRETEADAQAAFRRVNSLGTENLARQAASSGVGQFIFLSSVGVHGNRSDSPLRETDGFAPATAYALSKQEAEQALHTCLAGTGTGLTVIRPPLVYGPGAPGNFASLVRLVAKGWPLPLGGIDNRRSLVCVDNLVDFIALCMTRPEAVGESFLVSDDEDIATPDLVKLLGEALGRPARLVAVPEPLMRFAAKLVGRGETWRKLADDLQIDPAKAKNLLGWSPPLTLREGIARALSR